MFRRRGAGATDGTAQDSPGAQSPDGPADDKQSRSPAEAGKGRPTPKRSEAERKRYQPITGSRAPATPRTPADKQQARSERARRYESMKRGEEWALNPRDRGPVKALARDFVDSKRRVSEYYMYILLVLVVALFFRNKAVQAYISPLILVLVVVILIDAQLIRRSLARLVAERLPGQSTRGLTIYAVLRALQIRRFRIPAPRVHPGDKILGIAGGTLPRRPWRTTVPVHLICTCTISRSVSSGILSIFSRRDASWRAHAPRHALASPDARRRSAPNLTATPNLPGHPCSADLVRAGKVLYVGVSEWRAEEIAAALRAADELGLDRIVSNQPQYNMLWRVIEAEVIPLCEKEGLSQIVWSPIAQGVLTGKYAPGAVPPAHSRATDPAGSRFMRELLTDEVLSAVQGLRPLAEEAGLSMAQLAVAWTLQNPNVSAAIIGATRPEQVRENAKAAGVRLDAGLMSRIDEVLGGLVVRDPAETGSPPTRP